MASIHQLSAQTSHRLSMGQVVTSVFSVVKELLENALDAGATAVDVRLDDFGLEKIEVRDNGSGVSPEDTAVMGQAHFTSKLQHLSDMGSLSSLGFRGEALSAVCASCEVTVATRTAAEQAGRLVTLDASGAIVAQRPVARAQGTTVTAACLFSRQPVRRQLYGSARRRREDLKSVETLLAATAASRPYLRLALHHNGSQVLNKAPCESARSAAVQVLRSEAARLLRPLTLREDTVSVEVLLPAADASPKITGRAAADQCFVIVNGRVVSHRRVEKLLRDQFSARHGLSPARTPVCVVRVTVPPDQLDVNLEPNKTRLLLLCEEQLLSLLERGLAEFYRAAETEPATAAPGSEPGAAVPSVPAAGPDSPPASAGPAGTEPAAAVLSVPAAGPDSPPAGPAGTELGAAAGPLVSAPAEVCGALSEAGDGRPLSGTALRETTGHTPAPVVRSAGDTAGSELHRETASVTADMRAVTSGTAPVTAVTAPLAAMTAPVTAVSAPVTTVTAPLAAMTAPVTAVPAPVTTVTAGDGVPELADIQWEAADSLFGDSLLGASRASPDWETAGQRGPSEADTPGPGLAGRDKETQPEPWATGQRGPSEADSPGPGLAGRDTETQPDPWATGRLLDSQGELIEPTKLVTSLGEPAPKRPRLQPSIRDIFSPSGRPAPPSNGHSVPNSDSKSLAAIANGHSNPDSNPSAAGANITAPAANGHSNSDSNPPSGGANTAPAAASRLTEGGGRGSAVPAPRPPRPSEPGEPVYEPVASQVVRRAGSAFHYYCRDMRRKYLSLDPTMDIGRLSAALADGWRAALPSVRRQFEDLAREDERRYREDVRKAKLAELIQPPQRTLSGPGRVETQLRRLVAPLTPEARAHRPRRRSQKLSLRRLREEVARAETTPQRSCDVSAPRLIGPLESQQAWVVLRASQLLLVNPGRLSETCTLSRLLATYRFPARQLVPPRPLSSASVGGGAHHTLLGLPREGSRVADARVEASGFRVEVCGEAARLVAAADCMPGYGEADLAELLRKVAAGAETVADSRPARAVSWLQAEAVRIARGGGARLSREEVAALVHDAGDLCGDCFHNRPLAAPLYELVT